MASNFDSVGESVTYTNSSGSTITADSVVVMGTTDDATLGIAHDDILDTESGPVYITGVWKCPKVSGAVIVQGEYVIWDSSAGEFDDNQATPASGDVSDAAIAVESAGSGVTTVKVKLCPAGTLTA